MLPLLRTRNFMDPEVAALQLVALVHADVGFTCSLAHLPQAMAYCTLRLLTPLPRGRATNCEKRKFLQGGEGPLDGLA